MADTGLTVWAPGFWADGFWAAGFWAGGAAATTTSNGGSWADFFRYEEQRDKRRRRFEEADEAVTQIPDAVTQEIAQILHKQEREDERRQDLERLRALAATFPKGPEVSPRVAAAVERAQARQTASSLLNFEKELRRMMEEEEMAVLMMMLED